MQQPPRCRVDCADTSGAVDALAQEWAELERATPEATGFQSFRWCRIWLDCARSGEEPRVVCVREGERLVMLLPLQVERRLGFSIVRWMGQPMTQYGDALALPGEGRTDWRAAAFAEMRRWRDVDLVALTQLRGDGVLASAAVQGEKFSAPEKLSAPYVDLRAGGRRRHKSVERRAKWLETIGPVSLEAPRTPAEREELAERALSLKRAWLRDKRAFSAGLSNPASEAFIAAAAREGVLRVHALRVGEEIAALDVGFVGGGAYRSLLGCYDIRFAEGAPGQSLTGRVIGECAAEGLLAYDFLLPADAYKLAWATGETPILARFIALNFRGRLAAFGLARLRPQVKRVVRAANRWRATAAAFALSYARARLVARKRGTRQ